MTQDFAMIFLSLLGLAFVFKRNSFFITSNLRLNRKNLLDNTLQSLFILLLFLISKNILIAYLLILLIIKYYKSLNNNGKSGKKHFILNKPEKNEIIKGIKLLITIWPLLLITSIVSNYLFSYYPDQKAIHLLISANITTKIYIIMSAVLVTPIVEEYVFRNVIYKNMKSHMGVLWSAITTSLIFSLVHLNIKAFGPLFILSIFFCILYEHTRKLNYPIYCHIAFNQIMIIIILINHEIR